MGAEGWEVGWGRRKKNCSEGGDRDESEEGSDGGSSDSDAGAGAGVGVVKRSLGSREERGVERGREWCRTGWGLEVEGVGE